MKWPLRNGGATYLRNVTDTVQTVQYSDSQCTQQQYWHEHWHCSWLHAGLYCKAPRPFTRFVFYFFTGRVYRLVSGQPEIWLQRNCNFLIEKDDCALCSPLPLLIVVFSPNLTNLTKLLNLSTLARCNLNNHPNITGLTGFDIKAA